MTEQGKAANEEVRGIAETAPGPKDEANTFPQMMEAKRLLLNMEKSVLAAAASEMSSSDTNARLNSRLGQSLADAVGLSVDFKSLTKGSQTAGT